MLYCDHTVYLIYRLLQNLDEKKKKKKKKWCLSDCMNAQVDLSLYALYASHDEAYTRS